MEINFGILYYPFQLLIDFLNRISRINDTTTAIISVPEFTLSFMGYSATIFKATSFDLNSILVNETYKNIHAIYLGVVDIILWLGLVYLAQKCIHNILGGMDDDVPLENDYDTSDNHIGFGADISKNRKKRR